MAAHHPVIVAIGGSDSSGCAGLQQDWRTLESLGASVRSVVTAVTSQSSTRVYDIHMVPTATIGHQIVAAMASDHLDAIKVGMLGTRDAVLAVQQWTKNLRPIPMVIDPILASTSGKKLLDSSGRDALVELLCPHASIITPNIPEAAILMGKQPATSLDQQIAHALELETRLGAPVLVKGGHAAASELVIDILANQGHITQLQSPRRSGTPRGTGCALASSIAVRLAQGSTLADACRQAQLDVATICWPPMNAQH